FPLTETGVVQEVLPPQSIRLPIVDLTETGRDARHSLARDRVLAEVRRPFALAEETPFRATLIRVAEEEYVLVPVVHHIAFDRWFRGVLLRELAVLYSEFAQGGISPLSEPRLQYQEYARQQREQLDGVAMKATLAYWYEQLRNVPDRLELPSDRSRPAFPSYRGDYVSL